MTHGSGFARVRCPGVCVLSAFALLLAGWAAACGSPPQETSAERRVWQGPGEYVASRGVTSYERREIAQRVELPVCIEVQSDRYRLARVSVLPAGLPTPPGVLDTGFRLNRWRLWAPSATPVGAPSLFVIVLGSTGTVAEYERLPSGRACDA